MTAHTPTNPPYGSLLETRECRICGRPVVWYDAKRSGEWACSGRSDDELRLVSGSSRHAQASATDHTVSDRSDTAPTISVDTQQGVRVVRLGGEHDRSTSKAIATNLAAESRPTVIDLTAATFIDSSVVNELVKAADGGRPGSVIAAVAARSQPARVLSIVLDGAVLPVVTNIDRALELARDGGG